MKYYHILIFCFIAINLFSLSSTIKTLGEIRFEKFDIVIDSSNSKYEVFQIIANFESKDYLYIYPTYYQESDLKNQGVFKIYFKEYSDSDLNTVANYLKSDYSTVELNSELFIKTEYLNYKKASIFFITYGNCIFKANFVYAKSVNFPIYNKLINFQLSQFTLKKKEKIKISYDLKNYDNDALTILSKTSLRNLDIQLTYNNRDVTKERVANIYPNGCSIFLDRNIINKQINLYVYVTIINKNDKDEIIILGYNHYNNNEGSHEAIFPIPIKNGFQLYLDGNSSFVFPLKNSGEDTLYDQFYFYQVYSKNLQLQFLKANGYYSLVHFINEYSNMALLKVDSTGKLIFDFTKTPLRTGLYIQYIDYSAPQIAQKVLQPLVTGLPKSMLIPEGKSMFHYLPIQKKSTTTINYYLRFKNSQNMKVYFTTCSNYPEDCPNLGTQTQNYPIIENIGLWHSIPANDSELQLIYINCEKQCSYDIIMTYDNDPLFLFPENNYTKFTSNEDGDSFILPVFEGFNVSNINFINIDLNIISGKANLILKDRQTKAEITNYELKKIGNKKSYTIFKDKFVSADYFKNEIYITVKPDSNYKNTMYNLMYGIGESNIKLLPNNIINIELLKVADSSDIKSEIKIFNFANFKNEDLYISISTKLCKMKIKIDDNKSETVYSYSNKFSKGNHKFEIYLINDDEGICNIGFEEEVMLFAYHDKTNILLSENTFINSTFSTKTISFNHLFKFNNDDKSFNIEMEKLSGDSLKYNYKLEKISFNSSQENNFESAVQPIISKKDSFISTSQINSICNNLNNNEICSLTITFTSESKEASFCLYLNKNGQKLARHLRNENLINTITPDNARFYYIDLNNNYDTEIIINSYGQDLEYSCSSPITKQTDEEKILASLTSFSSGSNYHIISKNKDKACTTTYCRLYIGVRVSPDKNLKRAPTTFSISYLFKDSGNIKSEIELPLNYFSLYKFNDLNEMKYSINILKETTAVLELYTIKENEADDSEITATFSKKGSAAEDLQPNEKKIIKKMAPGSYEIVINNPIEDKKLLYKLRLSSLEQEASIIPLLSSYSEKCTLDTENTACYYKLDIPIDSKDNKAQYAYFYIPETEEVIISIKGLNYTSVLSNPNSIKDYDKLSNSDVKRSNWYEYKIEDNTQTLLVKISLNKPSLMNLTLYSSFNIKPNVVTLNYGEKRIFAIDKTLDTKEMNEIHFKINKKANKYRINLHAIRGNGIFTVKNENYPLGLDASYKENISIIVDSETKNLDLFAINKNEETQDQFAFTIDYTLTTTDQFFYEIYQNKKNSFKFLKDSNLDKITFYMKANKTDPKRKEYKKVEMNIKLYSNETKYDIKSYIVDEDFIEKIKNNDLKNNKLPSPVGTIQKFIDGGHKKSGLLSFLKLEIESDVFNNNETNGKDLYIYLIFTPSIREIKKVRIDLYPYEMPYTLPYNLPLLRNELFVVKIKEKIVYTLLFDKRDNYNENNPEIKIDFVRPLFNNYEISFEHDLNNKNNPTIKNESHLIIDKDSEESSYYGKQQIFLDPKLKKLLYMLFNINKKDDKLDTYIFNFRYNKYDIVEKIFNKSCKLEVEGNIQEVIYKVDIPNTRKDNSQIIIIVKAYKEDDINKTITNPEFDYLSLNLLFNDLLKPIDTSYAVFYKDNSKPIQRLIRTYGVKEPGDYYFTCVALIIDNEREEYLGYKAIRFYVEHSSLLYDYVKKHIFSTILIIIILLFFSGLIILVYRREMREMRKEEEEKAKLKDNDLKGELLNINADE